MDESDRRPPASSVVASLGLGVILLGLTGSLILGGATKLRCANGEWADGRQYRLLCYSDIVPLLTTERLQTGRLPYFEPCGNGIPGSTCDEYPC